MRDIRDVYNKMSFSDNIDFTAVVGHILELKEPHEYDVKWEKWNMDALPIMPDKFEYKVTEDKNDIYNDIERKAKGNNYDYIINACDAGREGELIFYSLYKHLNIKTPVKRLWISDTTEETIKKGLENLIDDKEFFNLKMSAQCRAYFDWLVGMNMSRAVSLKTNYAIPIGRVVTPTLKIIVDRELEILNFTPENFYQINVDFAEKFSGLWMDKEKNNRLDKKEKAQAIALKIKGTGVVESATKKQEKNHAPTLHSLLELQKEANKVFGYTADDVLKIAQSLYETHKIITYPRTESRYLPKSISKEITKHINALKDFTELKSYVGDILSDKKLIDEVMQSKKYVNDSKVTDHHAIIPTWKKADISKLNKKELNVYTLVAKRFVAIFLPPNILEKTDIVINVNGELVSVSGKIEKDKGYTKLYAFNSKDVLLPNLKKGDKVTVKSSKVLEKQTAPPQRYDDATLLQAMQNAGKFVEEEALKSILKETAGLGTSATRADVISKLISKVFIERKGKVIYPTQKGIDLIRILGDRDIAYPELTATWEGKLKQIEEGDMDVKQAFKEMKEFIIKNVEDIRDNLTGSITDKKVIGKCPKCGESIVAGKQYYLCTKYKDTCDFIIAKDFFGSKISESDAINLITGKQTSQKTLTAKDGQKYKGNLILKDGQVKLAKTEQKTIGRCPKCQEELIETDKYFRCKKYKEGCDFILAKDFFEAKITTKDIQTLLKGEKIEKTLKFKDNKTSKCSIHLEDNQYKIEFKDNQKIATCPFCNGEIFDGNSYYCKNNSCGFSLGKTIKSKNISVQELQKILKEGKSSLMDFKWANGSISKAKVVLKKDKTIGFEFELTKKPSK